ncbi:hypothetical protein [Candidatus Collinsella stercoripullorum]|uniref:hypothetical protein n=1 Tax=Candidatus Collinsella stercoripullorum TaxID=2838522 RepID=UPI0022DEDACA|nr:hypothetical protein [Candidatus Collinsella stercoripullorum]
MLSNITVLCDKPTDAKLFNYLKKSNTELAKIPDSQVKVLPKLGSIQSPYREHLEPLLQFDRADYYFCLNGKPLVVVEVTEHGYTGDNCLQRFARIAKTAEVGVPFIYFAPVARTRYDELDNRNASYRNVNSDMYRGFVKLTKIYSVPVVAVPWKTGGNGIPLILGADDPKITGIEDLFNLVASLLVNHAKELYEGRSVLKCHELQKHLDYTAELAKNQNVRDSEVKHERLPFESIERLIERPSDRSILMPREYFFKGKAHKLLALMSLDHSSIKKCILPDNSSISLDEMFERYRERFSAKPWLYYYSGYQWRTEPNVGIVTNIDYVNCRSESGATVRDRNQFLCVHWPRIFWDKNSAVREMLLKDTAQVGSSRLLEALSNEMEVSTGNKPNLRVISSGPKVFGAWNDRVTVARIFRDTCDLVVLNDAVILGNMWE